MVFGLRSGPKRLPEDGTQVPIHVGETHVMCALIEKVNLPGVI
jgi:hypothetical protein